MPADPAHQVDRIEGPAAKPCVPAHLIPAHADGGQHRGQLPDPASPSITAPILATTTARPAGVAMSQAGPHTHADDRLPGVMTLRTINILQDSAYRLIHG